MSHFTVLVVGDVDHELAPFHEFECTGNNDEFVVDNDVTADYEDLTVQNIEDEGFEFVAHNQQPDLEGQHKYGYAMLDEHGNVVKVVNRTNPNRKWDWYVIGGRWRNFLLLKDGSNSDSARKSQIDFDGMRNEAIQRASEKYDKYLSIVADREVLQWESVRNSNSDIEEARRLYRENPANKDLIAHFGPFLELSEFNCSKEIYLKNASDSAFATYAAVKDRKWSEKGEMGWFGMSDDKMTQEEWNAQLSKMVNELPDDALITIVDCHI